MSSVGSLSWYSSSTSHFAPWHHPACSSQYFTRASNRSWVQTNLVGALKANGGVDLILAAHEKYYERSTIRGGIIHVLTNTGHLARGARRYCTADQTLRNSRSTALFTVNGKTLSARVNDQIGAELDTFTIQK